MKVVFLPLDERPCNYNYPKFLYRDYIDLVIPNMNILGDKKKAADLKKLDNFLLKESADADFLAISLDMLIYGGLLPSRLHNFDIESLNNRLSILKKIKDINPSIKIYAFILIMRCPNYSSDDEEPMYYEKCGKEIHKLGELLHQESLGMEVDKKKIDELKELITEDNLNDYLKRRNINLSLVEKAIEYRKDLTIDHLIIPQDDSSIYGFTAMDQAKVKNKINECNLSIDVLMYPGADEAGLSLLARCLLNSKNLKPKVFIKYAAEGAGNVIPLYEDRPLSETIKYHVLSSGGRIVSSYSEADIVLIFTNHSKGMSESISQYKRSVEYDSFRNIIELIDFIKDSVKDKKPVMIADNAYANGGDLSLLKALNDNNLLDKISSYAGWNTNANTIGTALAQGFLYLLNGASKAHYDFLALRYLEDFGYCSKVRLDVTNEELNKLGFNYFDVKERDGIVSRIVKERLEEFKNNYLSSIARDITILECYMPWKRMFEVSLKVKWTREETKKIIKIVF